MQQHRRALLFLAGSALWLAVIWAVPIHRAGPDPSPLLLRPASNGVVTHQVLEKRNESEVLSKREPPKRQAVPSFNSYAPLTFGRSSSKIPNQKTSKRWSLFPASKHQGKASRKDNVDHEKPLAPLPPPKEGEHLLGNFIHGKDWTPHKEHQKHLATNSPSKIANQAESHPEALSAPQSSYQRPDPKLKGKRVETGATQESSKKGKEKVQLRSESKLQEVFHPPVEAIIEPAKKTMKSKVLSWVRGGKPSRSEVSSKEGQSKTSSPASSHIDVRADSSRSDHASTSEAAPVRVGIPSPPSQATPAAKKKGWNPLSAVTKKLTGSQKTPPHATEKTDTARAKELLEANKAAASFSSAPYDQKVDRYHLQRDEIEARKKRIDAEELRKMKGKGPKRVTAPKIKMYKSPGTNHQVSSKGPTVTSSESLDSAHAAVQAPPHQSVVESPHIPSGKIEVRSPAHQPARSAHNGGPEITEIKSSEHKTVPTSNLASTSHAKSPLEAVKKPASDANALRVKLPAGMTPEQYFMKMSNRKDPLIKTAKKKVQAAFKSSDKDLPIPRPAQKMKNPLGDDIMEPEYKEQLRKWKEKKDNERTQNSIEEKEQALKGEGTSMSASSPGQAKIGTPAREPGEPSQHDNSPRWMPSHWAPEMQAAKAKKGRWPWSGFKVKDKTVTPASQDSARTSTNGWTGLLTKLT